MISTLRVVKVLTLYKDERLAQMSKIELFSNKDEDELMVSFNLDEENQVINQEVFVHIPSVDAWIEADSVMNSKVQKMSEALANSLIESYLMNMGR